MPEGSLSYHVNTTVTRIHIDAKLVSCADGSIVPYDVLVLATGSDALLPRHTPGYDANGVFVYRTIDDLQRLIAFAQTRRGTTGAVVGGGLLGLEAAKAMMDLEDFGKVKLIERNRWVLSRQLDSDAGSMVVEQVRDLGLDVMLSKRVGRINVDADNNVAGVRFEDGEEMECSCICFAVSTPPPPKAQPYCQVVMQIRSGSVHSTSLHERQTSDVQIGVAALLLTITCKRLFRVFMLSESAPVGRIPLSASSARASRWLTFLPSISRKPKCTQHESSRGRT